MTRPLLLAAAALLAAGPLRAQPLQSDSTWRDHDRAADSAAARRDWADVRRHLLSMDQLLGGHPGVALALARNAVRTGDTAETLAQLRRIAAMGVVTRGIADSAFDGLRAGVAFQAIATAIAANSRPLGSAELVAALPDSGAIAEDLAWDGERRRFLVSDVRGHRILTVAIGGGVSGFGRPLPPGWAVLGLGVDARRRVAWATVVTLPQAEGYTSADSGRSAILRLDLATGAVRRRIDLPAPSRAAPGDLAVADNGDVFVGDGQTGAVYVIRQGRDSLEILVPAGRMRGTQQPAPAPDRRTFFIPDYGRGIARVDRVTGAVSWLARPDSVTLTGIDGLLWYGRGLIAVQNGVTPNRIVYLSMDAELGAVTGSLVLLRDPALAGEPTHVTLAEGRLYAIGNAGWGKYQDDGTPSRGAERLPPGIVRLDLHGLPPER